MTVHRGQGGQAGAAAAPAPGTAQAAQRAAESAQAAHRAAEAAQSAQQARADADRMIEQAIQEAERAANAAGTPQVPPVPPVPTPPGDAPIVFSSDNGRPVSISMKDGNLVLAQEGNTQVIPLRTLVPREAVQIAWAIPATLSILLIWWPLSRAVIRWLDRKRTDDRQTTQLQQRLDDRFATLERNIDTVAVEVERLAEGQRFTTKLLAERDPRVAVNATP
ncbi:MAG: hypothetical protein ACK50C_19335 [Gemmatimonadaceae bacterium]